MARADDRTLEARGSTPLSSTRSLRAEPARSEALTLLLLARLGPQRRTHRIPMTTVAPTRLESFRTVTFENPAAAIISVTSSRV